MWQHDSKDSDYTKLMSLVVDAKSNQGLLVMHSHIVGFFMTQLTS